jgi:hypothetical protein
MQGIYIANHNRYAENAKQLPSKVTVVIADNQGQQATEELSNNIIQYAGSELHV